jgi:hypothetical protein
MFNREHRFEKLAVEKRQDASHKKGGFSSQQPLGELN